MIRTIGQARMTSEKKVLKPLTVLSIAGATSGLLFLIPDPAYAQSLAIDLGGGGGGGGGGGAGSFNSTTYTIVNSTDYLVITVGAGGAGKQTVRDNAGGNGARGAVRIKGVLA